MEEKQVSRANMTFLPSPSDKPNIKEIRSEFGNDNQPKHPMDLFTLIQNENPWVDLSIRTIAGGCSATVPLFTIRGNKKQKAKIELYTQKLKHPNPHTTGYELFHQTYADLATYGNSYWQIIKDKKGDLHSIYRIPAPNVIVKALADKNNNISLYYIVQSPNKEVYDEQDIIQFKLPNPDSFLYGKPLFYPNLTNITIDENVSAWVRSFFEKSYSGGAIFKMEADETVADRNRLWLKEEYTKPENAGKPMLLEGEMELVSDGSKFKDLDYKDLKSISKEEILEHAGVPLSVAGVRSDNGQANVEVINSEQESFVRTMDIYHNIIFSRLEQFLFQTIFNEPQLTISPGMNRRFTNKAAADLAQAASQVAMTINENRALLNQEPIEPENGGNIYIVKTNNGIVNASEVFGVDLNTGEKKPTAVEQQQAFQEKMADKQAKVTAAAKARNPGGTNLNSNATSPSGKKPAKATPKK